MAITIPNVDLVRPTTKSIRRKPSVAKTAMVNPGPVRVSTTGASASGVALVEPTIVREGYYGFNVRSNTPLAPDEESFGVIVGGTVRGFAGVEPGKDVFIDPTARPDPESTFSGLTHTVPAGGRAERIGVGITVDKIEFNDC